MKKIILLLSLLAGTNAFAQTELPKGLLYGGLTVNLSGENSENENKNGAVTVTGEPTKTSYFNIQPEISYYIANNLAIGLSIGFSGRSHESTTKTTTPDVTTVMLDKTNGPSARVFCRKFWGIRESFFVFGGVSLNTEMGNGTYTVTRTENNVSTEVKSESEMRRFSAGFNAGMAYHISQRFMLIGEFSALNFYSQTNKNNIQADSYSQLKRSGMNLFFASGSIPFNFGFIYLLNSKSK